MAPPPKPAPAPKPPKDNPTAIAVAQARCTGLMEIAERYGKGAALAHLKPKTTMSLADLEVLEATAEATLYSEMSLGSMDTAYLAIVNGIEQNRRGLWNVFEVDVDGISAMAASPEAKARRALHLDVLQNRYRGAMSMFSGPWIGLGLETFGLINTANAANWAKRDAAA
jgi:hypothetical protein